MISTNSTLALLISNAEALGLKVTVTVDDSVLNCYPTPPQPPAITPPSPNSRHQGLSVHPADVQERRRRRKQGL